MMVKGWRTLLFAGLLAASPAVAQKPAPIPPQQPAPAVTPPGPSQPSSTAALTAADLGAWLDGYFAGTLKPGKIAGAQIVVVKDGQILFKKGYGFADMAAKRPMDVDRTLMRIGSTSKLLTWTAVMQQVQAGRIDLNADINRYLDFKIVPKGPRPITMNDLMVHRAGFEEGIKDLLASDLKQFKSNERYLKENRRPMLFPVGEMPAYSNYGASLAGYIVQRVSGEPFDDYIARHILAPLQMRHTTFSQPLPPALARDLSKGYRQSDLPAEPFELVTTSPAGSVSTTGTDMANFMIAHLQDGRFGNAQILRPDVAKAMHMPVALPQAGFDTLAHGFFYGERNGRLVLGHGGDTQVFHTDLNLLPAEGVGVFVSFNSRGENSSVYGARERLWNLFLDRYFPGPAVHNPPALASAAADAAALAGRYESSRRIESGFISLFYLLQQETISANDDNTVSLASVEGKRFREIGPKLWREVDGTRQLAVTELLGRKTVIDSENPIAFLQAVPLARNAALNTAIIAVSVLVLLVTVLLWPVRYWVRRRYGLSSTLDGRDALAQRLARVLAVADLFYLAGWYRIVAPILQVRVDLYNASLDGWLRFMQIAVIVPIAAAAVGLWNAWLTLRRSDATWGKRVRSVGLAAALLGIVWIAWMGGLASFNLNY